MSFQNNNNNDGKKPKKSLDRFLDKQGFYLILLLCVSVVLVTAVWVSRQENEFLAEKTPENVEEELSRVEVTLVEEDAEADEDIQETAIQQKPNEEIELKESPRNMPQEEARAEEAKPQEAAPQEVKPQEPKPEETKPEPAAATQEVMIQPVTGKVGLTYAMDHLVYHETLEHWSTHDGIDIHAEEGAPVRAVLDGEVVEVLNDTIMGITITLLHDEDLLTRYSNLSTDAMVKVGQTVAKGQVISGVGRTAAMKTVEGPLLHFQVLEDGRAVDPQSYLPKLN
ncbi:peptidase M23B [Clostridium aceticum]|uniref:Peptidase M23B n=1 Tax=Clostridium aceticum TaxID=84022 RepID=A0A0G3W8G9_9CLOT|nr:M23 family metallopeptidase [Clostridium aceticum]AKL93744.1 peptidase M23B [Clostridium aceticum]